MQNVHGGRQSWAQLLVPPPGHSKVSRISTVSRASRIHIRRKEHMFLCNTSCPADRMQVFHDEHGKGGPSAWKERDLVIKPGAPVCAGTQLAPPVIQQFRISVLLTIANADSACNK
jgi:hypothetical protein